MRRIHPSSQPAASFVPALALGSPAQPASLPVRELNAASCRILDELLVTYRTILIECEAMLLGQPELAGEVAFLEAARANAALSIGTTANPQPMAVPPASVKALTFIQDRERCEQSLRECQDLRRQLNDVDEQAREKALAAYAHHMQAIEPFWKGAKADEMGPMREVLQHAFRRVQQKLRGFNANVPALEPLSPDAQMLVSHWRQALSHSAAYAVHQRQMWRYTESQGASALAMPMPALPCTAAMPSEPLPAAAPSISRASALVTPIDINASPLAMLHQQLEALQNTSRSQDLQFERLCKNHPAALRQYLHLEETRLVAVQQGSDPDEAVAALEPSQTTLAIDSAYQRNLATDREIGQVLQSIAQAQAQLGLETAPRYLTQPHECAQPD